MSEATAAVVASCAELVRTFDWGRTPLGAYDEWPDRLRGYVSMILEMPTPAIIFWGPTQVQLYNDGYAVIMGPRHPAYYGATYRECWPDTYPVIYPWMQRVLRGEVIQVEKTLFTLTRYGFTEEAYFTFTFSPLRDDTGEIAGILQPVFEVTHDVLNARRAIVLHALEHPTTDERTTQAFLDVLAASPKDIPFAAFIGPDELAVVGVDEATIRNAPPPVASGAARVIEARDVLGAVEHTCEWGDPTRDAYVIPVGAGALVLGISPRLRFDDAYRSFFHTIARQLAVQLETRRARTAELELQQHAETARGQAELERKRLQSIFVNAPVAITILTGREYVVELANPRVCEIWGRDLADVLNKPLFVALPEIVGQGLEELLEGVWSSGEAYVGTELRVQVRRRSDGKLRDVFFNFVYEPLKDAAGNVESVLVVATEVTGSVLARQAAERLATELEGARRDAEQARDLAQDASRAKDDFLAMLGHELRNPLAPIFTALDLWQQQDRAHEDARIREVIDRQARHLRVLVDDLLDISRITRGKIELDRKRVALATIVAKAIETASPMFEKRAHELRIDVAPDLYVHADSARGVQVFANLLMNAAKYTDAGGRIEVTARADGAEVVASVRDTGRGISPDVLPRIFDLFVQERQNLDRSMGGLGIGLAIVKNLVAMHGGSVEAHSDGPGHGSTFTVRLPAASGAPAQTATPAASVRAARQAGRILIIDDNEDAAVLLGEMLRALGYDCTITHDGPRGIAVANETKFDFALVDIGLPAMDGYEVARNLRSLGGAALQLIAITGYGQEHDRVRAFEAGFDEHLVKPVDLRVLTSLLANRRAQITSS